MRQILALALGVVVTACGASSASAPSATPATTQDNSTLACRMPVYRFVGGSAAGSFIDFPSGAITDASAKGTYYDTVVRRWLPIFRDQVSPDGLRYAFFDGWTVNPPTPTRVHVVNAATGAEMLAVSMPDMQPYFVMGFTNTGIYLGNGFGGRGPGVWRLDPDTGKVTKASDGFYPPDAQWIGVVDPKDPQPYRSAMTGMAGENRIDRRVAGGSATTWFYRPGHVLLWIPFAGAAKLLVQASWSDPANPAIGGVEYWLVTAPNRATEVAAYTYQESSPYSGLTDLTRAVADKHGVWIGGGQSLYLVTPSGSILREYAQSVYPAGTCS